MPDKHYVIRGIIKHQDTLAGIEDLVVVALDYDPAPPREQPTLSTGFQSATTTDFDYLLQYDRIGSVLTDSRGAFELLFREEDFRVVQDEPRPDILLFVQAPEVTQAEQARGSLFHPLSFGSSVIHVSPPIRLKAGRTESYSIRVSPEIAGKYGLGRRMPASPESLAASLKQGRELAVNRLGVRIDNLKKLLESNTVLKSAADEVFASFSLSTVPLAKRALPTYLDKGDNLVELQRAVIERVTMPAEAPRGVSLTLALDRRRLDELGLLDAAGALSNSLPLARLWRWWADRNDTAVHRQRGPNERCLAEFTEADLERSAPDPVPAPDSSPKPDHPTTTIDEFVRHQIACGTCPEEPLRYAKLVDPDHRQRELKETIGGLELVSGPTDVTSYHDFHSVQIAFETIWTEAFDEVLPDLGREIFSEVVSTYETTCEDTLIHAGRLNVTDPSSLRFLLTEYRRTSGNQGSRRLDRLFEELEERLLDPYKFDVFAPDSFNYGVVFTFRQKWEPGPYQAGRLVNTIPLAPKEERKYTTKVRTSRARGRKELEDREFKGASESQTTARAETEIVDRAVHKTSFSTNASGGLNMEMFQMQFGMNTGMDSEKFSSATKKNFRESVIKAAQEYRKQTKLEVSTTTEDEAERTTSGTLVNPNDEISVTYLFYELQRQYHISEQLHQLTPIVLFAFDVPKPHEIDDDWLMTHAWILRRVLLDEGFHAALDYVTESSVGGELAMQELSNLLKKRQESLDHINEELRIRNEHVDGLVAHMTALMTGDAAVQTAMDIGHFVNGLLNPFAGLMGGGDSGPDLEKFKEVLQLQLERSEKEQQRLAERLKGAHDALEAVTEKYAGATREYFDRQASVAQLRVHVKENILYYMQAIWDYEPADQRYFRLYDKTLQWFESPEGDVSLDGLVPRRHPETGEIEWVEGSVLLPLGGVRRTERKLVDVADIDTLLGFKGNYAMFPAKEPNYLHLHMMSDFVDTATGGVKDADSFSDMSTQDLVEYIRCVRSTAPDEYEREKERVLQLINERRRSPRKERELVIVPTDCLYLECLPGKHAVLEDFKLVHRAMDVKRVQAEVRRLELENARYAARLLSGEHGDPEIEKHVVVGSAVDVDVNV